MHRFLQTLIHDSPMLKGISDSMRYLPHNNAIRKKMLESIGETSIAALFDDIPSDIPLPDNLDLPNHKSEQEVEAYIHALSKKVRHANEGPFFVGGGLYNHHIPATVDHLIQRGEFLTSYTPYQPEVSQGTLQYLFEFQTQVAELFGMDVANASMYDGATALAEAVMMATRLKRRKKVVLSGRIHPHYKETVETYATFGDFDLIDQTPLSKEGMIETLSDDVACVAVQYPDFLGEIESYKNLIDAAHQKDILVIFVVTEVVSLGLLTSPGDLGADIVVGEGQSLGNGLNFGGPTVGLFACKSAFLRQMPGRLCGETVDSNGKRGFTLTLNTREQHIRREKATSNICTNSGLCSLAFSIHLTLLGGIGLEKLAKVNHQKACKLYEGIKEIRSIKHLNNSFFNEFCIELPIGAEGFVESARKEHNVLAGIPLSRLYPGQFDKHLLISVTELVSDEDIQSLLSHLKTL